MAPGGSAADPHSPLPPGLPAPPRRSPVQWLGPKRVVPPAFAPDHPQLPRIDAVLLSHNHYGAGGAVWGAGGGVRRVV